MSDRFGYGEIGMDINPCRWCEDYEAPNGCKSNGGCGKPQTNGDRIRAMTDEELAEYLIADIEAEAVRRAGRYLTSGEINRAIADCLSWLKSPVEVDE